LVPFSKKALWAARAVDRNKSIRISGGIGFTLLALMVNP
jgi:hypothetical protein